MTPFYELTFPGKVLTCFFLLGGVIVAAYFIVEVINQLANSFRELRDIWKS